jgi:hypothetical protein
MRIIEHWSGHFTGYSKRGLMLLGLALLSLTMACSFIGGGESEAPAAAPAGSSAPATNAQAKNATPIPEPTPLAGIDRRWTEGTSTAANTGGATFGNPLQPTPAPATNYIRTPEQVEEIAWGEIRSCADQINALVNDELLVGFDSTYSTSEGLWRIDAYSIDPSLDFGNWLVIDSTGELIANDALAQEIDTPGNTCALPESELATGRTAPIVGEPISITAPNQAAEAVWEVAFSCVGELPQLSRFPAIRDGATTWVVGRSADSRYGQWSLNAVTGEVKAISATARQNEGLCQNSLAAITPDRAMLRVWLASYECFTPSPDLQSFATYQENHEEWIVEAKEVANALESSAKIVVPYGLWTVNVVTGAITPLDRLARDTANKTCFKAPN